MLLVKKKRMANGRSMFLWIEMYVVPTSMFLFVLITASLACESKKKGRKSAFVFFSFMPDSDWLSHKLEFGLVMLIKKI